MKNLFGEEIKEPEEEKVEKSQYKWEYENSINTGTNRLIVDKNYSQYRTNAVLMKFLDTILLVNELNNCKTISDQMHYDYLFHSVRKRKRFSPSILKDVKKEETINLISSYYKYNITRSKEIVNILNSEQLNIILKDIKKKGEI